MPDVSLSCDCGRALTAPPRWSGRRVLCPACRREHVVPEAVPPQPPAWRSRRWRRWGARTVRAPVVTAAPARQPPPPGLRVAARPKHPGDVAATRRRRRRVVLVTVLVLVAVVTAIIGLRIGWQRYRRSLYRGLEPTHIRPASEQRDLRARLAEVSALARRAASNPTSTGAAAAYTARARDVIAELARLGSFPADRAVFCNELAWFHLTTPLEVFRDPEAARELAEQALHGKFRHEPAFLDTFAEALFQTGRYAEAQRAAEEAVRRAPEEPALRETLERIEDALLR